MAKAKKTLTAVERRAEELDTIAAVLPIERRDELAELLTDHDVETLRHLVNQGMGDNTLRALTSDLTYLEAPTTQGAHVMQFSLLLKNPERAVAVAAVLIWLASILQAIAVS
ncbi:Hypothetical protein NGAL_HAMBI2605_58010 [Neorhizobium galegae bv. orientalis]|nr:Hypothetical protein NGAL_HAMBI2605_58010 [Neorhizobium galegae bv. orientalis]